jgi:hypothetical protein
MTKPLDTSGASAPEAGELARRLRETQQLLAHVHLHLTNDENFDADELEADMRKLDAGRWIDTESLLIDERAKYASLLQKLAETEKRLAEATGWFREYEAHHRAKGDTDKAERNRLRAEACSALRPAATSGKPAEAGDEQLPTGFQETEWDIPNLVAFVRRLSRAVQKHEPDSKIATGALGWLERRGFHADILRRSAATSGKGE